MKSFLIYFFVLILVQISHAQIKNIKHVDHNNYWYITVPQWIQPGYDFIQSFSTDSFIIENNYYRKQIIKLSTYSEWEETILYFREDEGKVYKREANEKEYLAFDYTAKVHDSLYAGSTNCIYVVSKVDSILTLDGKWRKRFSLNNSQISHQKMTWVEGIGNIESLYDLTSGCIIFDPEPLFNCMVTNNQPIYSFNSSCIVSLDDKPMVVDYSLKPNPVHDQFEISGDLQHIENVEICDIWGKPIITNFLNKETVFNINNLTSGIYLCHIKLKNGKNLVRKFTKI